MRRLICLVSVIGLVLVSANANAQGARPAAARPANADGFNEGYFDLGPVVGLGGIGGAGASIGARGEYGFKRLPSLHNGVFSIEASVDHYSYGLGGFGSFSYTPIGGTVNYHFRLDNRKLDPFFGVGLGDYIVTSPSGCGIGCSGFNSGIFFIGRVGFRYFVKPSIALYADGGTGAGALHVGVMFRVKH
jgi:hypothetical protein